MAEQRSSIAGGAPGVGEKRPYEKPAIAEEEAYETCAQLTCTFCQGGGNRAFKCRRPLVAVRSGQ
jgi:hypothetical protein